MSPQLAKLLAEHIERQEDQEASFLFSASTGNPWDMNLFRNRKMVPLLRSLQIEQAGFHAFRHFNASLLNARVAKDDSGTSWLAGAFGDLCPRLRTEKEFRLPLAFI